MRTFFLPIALLILLPGCDRPAPSSAASSPTAASAKPSDAFFAQLGALCGKAFAGRLVAFDERDRESFGGPAVMHVRACSEQEIRIPFHVGDDRSRTWIVSRVDGGLRLKHDHRHRDGSEDDLTQYGGDSAAAGAGTAIRQSFPADAESKAMFLKGGLNASVDNVWSLEVEPGSRFAYELRRPDRHFRVEFDLSQPVEAPPPPWGYE